MRESDFLDWIEGIYALFGKKMPLKKVTDAIFERVCSYPDAFMDYAKERLSDMDALPSNLGRFFCREVWPDFRDANPQLFTARIDAGCALCKPDLPGWRQAWNWDFSESFLLKCPCNRDPNMANVPAFTDEMIYGRGWRTQNDFLSREDPAPAMDRKMRKAIGDCERPRQRHERYMAENW